MSSLLKIGVNPRLLDENGEIGATMIGFDTETGESRDVSSRQVIRRQIRRAERVFISKLKKEALRLKVRGGAAVIRDRASARLAFSAHAARSG